MTGIEKRFRMANPIPDPANPPVTSTTAAAVLLDMDKRRGTMQTREDSPNAAPQTSPPRRRTGPLLAAAALVAVIIVGVGIWLAPEGDTVAPADATTSLSPAMTAEEALAVSDAYFAAYEAGDVDAMMALLTPDARITDGLGPSTHEARTRLLAYKVAEGTVFTARECSVVSELATDVTLQCKYGHHDYTAQVVDGPVVPHTLTMVVTDAGVTRLADIFGDPNFNVVGNPFTVWMAVHHPDAVSEVEFGNWSSAEEAREVGVLAAQYADEWAKYLEENGCLFSDGC
jgi:hypothetical protein